VGPALVPGEIPSRTQLREQAAGRLPAALERLEPTEGAHLAAARLVAATDDPEDLLARLIQLCVSQRVGGHGTANHLGMNLAQVARWSSPERRRRPPPAPPWRRTHGGRPARPVRR